MSYAALFSAPAPEKPPVKSSSDNPLPNFVNEKQRIKLLRELDLLDCDASEEAFDRITNMASRIFKVRCACLSSNASFWTCLIMVFVVLYAAGFLL